jgi:histidyl-tRNA synthetase
MGPALELAESLRNDMPSAIIISHCGGGSFKSQMKKADKSGARYALVLGENELASGTVGLKPLRSSDEQQDINTAELSSVLKNLLA